MGGGGAFRQDGRCQDFCQANGFGQLDQVIDHLRMEGAAGGLDAVLLHEGGDGVVELDGRVLGLRQHFLHALNAGDDGDLHQVRGNSGGSVLDHHLGKLRVGEHAAFDVDVGVQEAGSQIHALGVDDLGMRTHSAGGDGADGGDFAIGDGDLRLIDLMGDHVHQFAVLDHDVCGLLAQGYLNQFVVHRDLLSFRIQNIGYFIDLL